MKCKSLQKYNLSQLITTHVISLKYDGHKWDDMAKIHRKSRHHSMIKVIEYQPSFSRDKLDGTEGSELLGMGERGNSCSDGSGGSASAANWPDTLCIDDHTWKFCSSGPPGKQK